MRRIKAPAYIEAYKDGDDTPYYFEVKMTLKQENEKYFGAATETEWAQAIRDPDHYRFVLVRDHDDRQNFSFKEYALDDFRKYCSIPPFKIYCNIDLNRVSFAEYKYKNEKNSKDEKLYNTTKREAVSLNKDADNAIFQNLQSAFEKERITQRRQRRMKKQSKTLNNMTHSKCIHCTIIPQEIGTDLLKCELNHVETINLEFLNKIKKLLEREHRQVVPNGECPFSINKQQICPEYLEKH